MTHKNKMFPFTASMIRTFGNSIAPRGKGDGRLCVINYHRVLERADPLLASEPDVATFRWQMALLADCFKVLPLREAVHMLRSERMPPRAVCITFDDGYRSTLDLALPILREYDLPASVFVTTGHMEKGNMWNDIILEAVRRLPKDQLDLREIGLNLYSLKTEEERIHTVHSLTETSKYLPPEARQILTLKLESMIGNTRQEELMLTAEMIRQLAQNKVEIGGHTVSHPILSRLPDDAARYEITANKQQLEQIIGQPITSFAYPNGKRGVDYDQRHIQMLRDAGYDSAFTTQLGATTANNSPYEMPRGRPWDTSPMTFSGRLLQWLMGYV